MAVRAQSIALLDLQLQSPVTYTDSLTLEAVLKGTFPVYVKDVKPIISALEQLRKEINLSDADTEENSKLYIGHTALILQTQTAGRKKICHISLLTECNGLETYMPLTEGTFDRVAQQKLIAFADYLKRILL